MLLFFKEEKKAAFRHSLPYLPTFLHINVWLEWRQVFYHRPQYPNGMKEFADKELKLSTYPRPHSLRQTRIKTDPFEVIPGNTAESCFSCLAWGWGGSLMISHISALKKMVIGSWWDKLETWIYPQTFIFLIRASGFKSCLGEKKSYL